MRISQLGNFFSLLLLGNCTIVMGQSVITPSSPVNSNHLSKLSKSKSLYFLENKGQIKDQESTTAHQWNFQMTAKEGLSVFIGKGKLSYQWTNAIVDTMRQIQSQRMDVTLVNANPQAELAVENRQSYYEVHYNLEEKAQTGRKAYAYKKITYRDIYPNIDWVLYVNNTNELEYDFVIHPGGKTSDIQIDFDGSSSLQLNTDGSLTATTVMGSITEKTPKSYLSDGTVIASAFNLENNRLGFTTAPYEGTLIIDPVLEWASYYGGSQDEQGLSVATDLSGNVYMTGYTRSTANIATTGAYNQTLSGAQNGFLVKFDSSGNRLWGTYYAGTGIGYSVATDSTGNVFITGSTAATGLATTGVHQTTPGGASDAFVAKFDSGGNRLWHTYYGGSLDDNGIAIAVDNAGSVYLSGHTRSTSGISSAGASQATLSAGQDAFLVKFNTNGIREWGTYFGGELADYGYKIACDNDNNVYLCGRTSSLNNIATTGAHLTTYLGTVMFGFNFGYVGFLAKYSSVGVKQWSTYYGAEMTDATGVATDANNNVYIVGRTLKDTIHIASTGSYQSAMGSYGDLYGDGFLAKFDTTGSRIWGTYIGGDREEEYLAVACNLNGGIYVAGRTTSTNNIATPGALLLTHNDSCTPGGCLPDAFVTKFDNDGTKIWGTYYGTKKYDHFYDVATDGWGSIYLAGFSNSDTGIATSGAHQNTLGGVNDAILVKLYDCPPVPDFPPLPIGEDTICINSTHSYYVPLAVGTSHHWHLPTGWTGSISGDTVVLTAPNTMDLGILKVNAVLMCENRVLVSDTTSLNIYVPDFIEPTITVNLDTLATTVNYASYQWIKNGMAISGATGAKYTVTENADYQVAVVSTEGCSDTSIVYTVSNVTEIDDVNGLGNQISIYPNPTSDFLTIRSPEQLDASLFSVDGRFILSTKKTEKVVLKNLPDGTYFLHLFDAENRLIKVTKVVKQ